MKRESRPQNIYGAFLIEKWVSPKYDKTIYLFGEKHEKRLEGCPPGMGIDEFLEQEVKASKKKIDIFAEIETLEKNEIRKRRNPKTYLRSSFLFVDFHNRFLDCLQNDTKKCPYSNLRIHFIDNRMSALYTNAIYLVDALIGISHNLTRRPLSQVKKNALSDIKEFLRDEKDNYESQARLESLIESDLYDKNFKNGMKKIPYPEIVDLIQELSNSWRQTNCLGRDLNWNNIVGIFNQITQILQDLSFNDSEKLGRIEELILPIDECMTKIYTYTMDTNTLINIFKVERGRSAKNIIVYTGAAHSFKLGSILERLGFEKVYHKFNPDHINCLDISDLPLPLF